MCQGKDIGTKFALARKYLCMLNAANMVEKTGGKMGILRILYAGLGNASQ